MSVLRLGTRGSALAVTQSGMVADDLRRRGHEVELIVIETPGDGTTTPLTGRAHEGIFTSSISTALAAGEIDFAVHSFKDLPLEQESATLIAAVPRRVDPRDTIIANAASMADLVAGARVGTCSARRAAYVARVRPDLRIDPIRGNIDVRIAKVRSGEYDAIVLAAAGLQRLGVAGEITEYVSARELIPAPAQGALALECRVADLATRRALAELDDRASHLAALVEREVLHCVDGTDATAMGALATVHGDALRLMADASAVDGSDRLVVEREVHLAAGREFAMGLALAQRVADELLEHLQQLAA